MPVNLMRLPCVFVSDYFHTPKIFCTFVPSKQKLWQTQLRKEVKIILNGIMI